MNLLNVTVQGGEARLAPDLSFPLPEQMGRLAPGSYRIGIRPSHISLSADGTETVAIEADVDLAEISGSETYLHLRHGSLEFIAQVKGVHPFELGSRTVVWLARNRVFAFDEADRLVSAPIAEDPNAMGRK